MYSSNKIIIDLICSTLYLLQGGCLNRLDLFLSEYMVGQSKMYGNFIVRNAMDNLKCMYFDTLNANVNRLRARE